MQFMYVRKDFLSVVRYVLCCHAQKRHVKTSIKQRRRPSYAYPETAEPEYKKQISALSH